MSVRFLSKHIAKPRDSVESLVREYRLSSWRAITDIEANLPLRSQLMIRGFIPQGLMISIPPNAGDLLKERLYLLHRVRPSFLRHFDKELLLAEQDLKPLMLHAENPAESEAVAAILETMQREVNLAIEDLARQAWPLVSICTGMSYTHVFQQIDKMAAGTTNDSLCGLYWALSPPLLSLWRQIWHLDFWAQKWTNRDQDAAWQLVSQHQNTVRSLVIQQIDKRIRYDQKLERELALEASL
jgi:hypothetical protein